MILINSAFLKRFLCDYNWHGKDPTSTAKKIGTIFTYKFQNF